MQCLLSLATRKVEFLQMKHNIKHGRNGIGNLMRIFVDAEDECLGLIGSFRETGEEYVGGAGRRINSTTYE